MSVFKDKLSIFVGPSRCDLHGFRDNIFGEVSVLRVNHAKVNKSRESKARIGSRSPGFRFN